NPVKARIDLLYVSSLRLNIKLIYAGRSATPHGLKNMRKPAKNERDRIVVFISNVIVFTIK
ncbi:hypothetical protein MYX06_04260, partial [Patescibacteria group bacterium AH-259-L05]|nr:hypothetical protein [Patescibacteria group bacterium AH-259-L05]